jgi:hypothetical protein
VIAPGNARGDFNQCKRALKGRNEAGRHPGLLRYDHFPNRITSSSADSVAFVISATYLTTSDRGRFLK